MKRNIWLVAICLICLSGWATGCGGSRSVVDPTSSTIGGIDLPWPNDQGQSSTPRVTSAYNHRIDVTLTGDAFYNKSDNALVDVPSQRLYLGAGPNEASWAIYGFPDVVAGAAPFQIRIQLSGNAQAYYIGMADYQNQTWRWEYVDAPTGDDYFDIPSEYQPVSPSGKIYVAVVAWDSRYPTLANVMLQRSVVSPLHGIGLGPYLEGMPGSPLEYGQLYDLVSQIAPYCDWGIRTFSCADGLDSIPQITDALGLSVAVGCYLGRDQEANAAEIDRAVAVVHSYDIPYLIVGTEVLYRGDLTEDELVAWLQDVKQRVADTDTLVTTNDTCDRLLWYPKVMDECDVIMANFYPFWEGEPIDTAICHLQNDYWTLQNNVDVLYGAGVKPVIIGETGWPSAGFDREQAVPSPENAAKFFLDFVSWARAEDVEYFYFEAYDEPWKSTYGLEMEGHFGLWGNDRVLKPGMMPVFNGVTVPDNWSWNGSGDPTIQFTYVPPVEIGDWLEGMTSGVNPSEYRVAVYIHVPTGWWTKPWFDHPCRLIDWDGTWSSPWVTGGIDLEATEFAAFLIPNSYNPPGLGNAEQLPQELFDNAVAYDIEPRPN